MICEKMNLDEFRAIRKTLGTDVNNRGIDRVSTDRGLVGLVQHILSDHADGDFKDEMYRHMAAIGRNDIPNQPAPGESVEGYVVYLLQKFIEQAK